MKNSKPVLMIMLVGITLGGLFCSHLLAQEGIKGEKLEPSAIGPGYIESMEAAVERDGTIKDEDRARSKARNGQQGTWAVPSRRATYFPHSGEHYATNKWGDTCMGISFPLCSAPG